MDQAEQLRNIIKQQNMKPHSARVITVTSGKGGVGKSNVSVNLAIQMSRMGKKTVILDADFGLANIEIMLGIRPRYNLADMMFRGREVKDIICTGPEGIGFISGGSGVSELATLDNASIKLLISELVKLDQMYDVVIIDTGAGITDSVMEFVMMSPEVVLVVTPEPTSITDSYSLLKVLRRKNSFNPLYKTIHVVANRVENEAEGAEIFHKIDTVSSKFLNTKLSFLGAVLQDKNASMAVIEQKPLVQAYPGTTATKGICQLVNRLSDDTVEESKKKEGIARVFIDFFRSKKRIR